MFAPQIGKITSVLIGLVRLNLLLNLSVLVLMDLNRKVDGRGSNRSWVARVNHEI